MAVSKSSARAGESVQVSGKGCPSAALYLHDSYNLNHAKTAGNQGLTAIPVKQRGSDVAASFRVPRGDSTGRGLLVMECGGLVGSLTAEFTILP